jgi:hypothetical protein
MTDETYIRSLGLALRDLVDRGCLAAWVELPDGTKAVYRAGVLTVGGQAFTTEWLDRHGLEVAS